MIAFRITLLTVEDFTGRVYSILPISGSVDELGEMRPRSPIGDAS